MASAHASPVPSRSGAGGIGFHTILFLLIGYTSVAVDGAFQASPYVNPLFVYALSLVRLLNLGLWSVQDAKRRRHPIPLLAEDLFVVFAWVLVPLYAIQSRGWRGFAWVIFHGMGWAVTFFLAYVVTIGIVYG